MEYSVRSADAKTFSVTAVEKEIGRLEYNSWFSFKSKIITHNKVYKVEPKGFWGTTIEVKLDDSVVLNFKMNWIGSIIIHTNFANMDEGYIFKHKGILNSRFMLKDTDEQELLVIQPDFKWKKLSYDYAISTTDNFEALNDSHVLLLTTVHCANYYMTMMSSTISPAVV